MSWDDLYPHQFTDPVVWGWGTNAPIETYNLFYSKGTGNYACYENAATDAYLDEALAQPRVEDSFELWKKAQWDGTTGIAPQGDAPWVWFANIDHLYFAKDNLSGGRAEAAPARPRLVAREQRRPVVVGLGVSLPTRRGRTAPSRSDSPRFAAELAWWAPSAPSADFGGPAAGAGRRFPSLRGVVVRFSDR